MRVIRLPGVSIRSVCAAAAVLVVGISCQSDRVEAPVPAPVEQSAPRFDAVPTADPDSVRIHYLCENRFRIRNANDVEIAVQWVVVGTADSGTVVLPARRPGAPFSETFLDVPDSGVVRLFFGGARIASARNRGSACATRQLVVRLEPGVIATPGNLDSAYAVGTAVSYSFAAAPGYTHVLVALDDSLVPDTGTVVMGASHVLWAAADVEVTLPPATDPLVVELRGLLSAADPVGTYQQILDDVGALFNAVGPEEASRRVKLAGLVAYDPIRDSSALMRVDNALALHEFALGSSEYDGSGAGGGGGGLISNRVPVAGGGAMREVVPGGPCSAQRSPEVPGSPEPTVVLFVNGIETLEAEAAGAASRIRCALDGSGQTAGSTLQTTYFYNRTWSIQRTQDIRGNFWCAAASVRWGGYWSLLSQATFYGACAGAAARIAVQTNNYVEAVQEYVQLHLNSPGITEDADSLARHIDSYRRHDGMHVVLVAHSQGNLLSQQALLQLRAQGHFTPRSDSLCVGAVALAAPMSKNWPVDKTLLFGILVPGDIIGSLQGANRFPSIATPLSDSLAAEVSAIRETASHMVNRQDRHSTYQLATQREVLNGLRLHSLSGSYLGQQPTHDAIVNDIVYIHRQCTLGQLGLEPASATLRVQSTGPLELSATNRNGATMRLNRSVAWSVPPTLELSRNAHRMTAVSPGLGEISARVFDREARAAVEVPMESLDVSAVQTLHTSWKLELGGGPPSNPVPDPGPGPDWDGNPSHCTETKTLTGVDQATGKTWVAQYVEHCWFEASGGVIPPDGIRIAKYWWRWYDVTGAERDSHTGNATTYAVPDMSADPDFTPFPGWSRLVVWGLNADGTPIAKGTACMANCGGAP